MSDLNLLFHGFAVVLTPFNIGLMFVGIVLGVIIGVLPGLGAANGIAILLPLTFTMPFTGARCSAARSPRSCSIFPASPGRSRPPSTVIRWRRRGAPARH